jgi:hypothetical protein
MHHEFDERRAGKREPDRSLSSLRLYFTKEKISIFKITATNFIERFREGELIFRGEQRPLGVGNKDCDSGALRQGVTEINLTLHNSAGKDLQSLDADVMAFDISHASEPRENYTTSTPWMGERVFPWTGLTHLALFSV